MSYPAIRNVVDVVRDAQSVAVGLPNGRYVPARSLPFNSGIVGRIRAAWLVFTGRADALVYPGQS